MTIVLNLSDDLGERARVEAERRSQPLEEYILEVVAQTVPPGQGTARSLAILDSLDAIGNEEDHQDTYEALKAAEEEDGLSVRRRIA